MQKQQQLVSHSDTNSNVKKGSGADGDKRLPPNTHAHKEQTKANTNRRAAGSNWKAHTEDDNPKQQDEQKIKPSSSLSAAKNSENNAPAAISKSALKRQKRKNHYLAMDCEMVGIGMDGQDNMLARVSIVNRNGEVLLDKFVKPRETVIDYRTNISGVRPCDIENGEEFTVVQNQVTEMLHGKILIGHSIRKDLAVLHIKHPYLNIRDTSRYKPLARLVSNGATPSLKRLALAILGLEIQTGEHNSVEDARAAMNIYNRLCEEWEKHIQRHQHRK